MDKVVFYRHVSSPIGRLLLTSDGRALTGLHMLDLAEGSAPPAGSAWKQDDAVFARACEQLEAYFEGESPGFDLALDLAGTAFQRRVWDTLCEIPFGAAISYAELARRIGNPSASRAVGGANGQNPVAIIVPCHRVIGADGGLGGYGGGLDRKRWLLEHEAETLARHPEWRAGPAAGTIVPKLLRA
jgi:methylated-DNA-[protein]-cysteine S-methyltransferase